MLFAYLPAVFNVAIYFTLYTEILLKALACVLSSVLNIFCCAANWDIVSYYLHLPFSIMFVSTSYLCDSFLLTCCCLLLLLKFLLAMVITVIIVNMDMNQLFSADTFCKQISNDLQSLFWSYHCLFVSICHSMFSF